MAADADERTPAGLIGRSDDWWAGYRAGCEASHAHGCDAVQGERDDLRARLATTERFWAQRLADLQAEYGRQISALERQAERLQQDLSRLDWAGMLTEQTCRAGTHATWYVDDEGAVACPWCQRDEARAEAERLQAVEQRACEALAPKLPAASVAPPWDSVHRAAHYILTGER